MLAELKIQGFKCFDSEKFKLKNLTLLTGMNSTGKTAVLQALLFLMQCKNEKRLLNERIGLETIQEIRNRITVPEKISIECICGQEMCKLLIDLMGYIEATNTSKLPKELIYLSSEHCYIADDYAKNVMQACWLEEHEEYSLCYLIHEWSNELKEPQFITLGVARNLEDQVNYWLNYVIDYSVTLEKDLEGAIHIFYYHGVDNHKIKPDNAGAGVRYVTNIIMAALSCTKESVFIVENPELFLHPRMQSRLMDFLCYLAENGLQIIIETHSDYMLSTARINIKNDAISREKVQVYYFVQDSNQLIKPVIIQINDDGTIQNYVEGFLDQFDEEFDELLDL